MNKFKPLIIDLPEQAFVYLQKNLSWKELADAGIADLIFTSDTCVLQVGECGSIKYVPIN